MSTAGNVYSRFAAAIDAQKTYKAKALVASLKQLIIDYGKPKYIRCDNGSELISKQLEKFCVKHETVRRCDST
ncbi:MAG: transposase [Sphingobacteriales bacterium]|nr:MAG: transposase [Sphingobacteriales bacterium]